MVQVMSVSANAAAFVMEVLKPPLRKSAKMEVDDSTHIARAAHGENENDVILPVSESIAAVSARLAMLDSNHPHQQQTLNEVVEAYRRSGA